MQAGKSGEARGAESGGAMAELQLREKDNEIGKLREENAELRAELERVRTAGADGAAAKLPPQPLALSRTANLALLFAFATFLAFSIAEVMFALIANSLSMLGDAASMIVDAFTYCMNLVAVHLALRGAVGPRVEAFLTLVAPSLSAAGLCCVTAYIVEQAAEALAADPEPVSTTLMLTFGLANLGVDVLNLYAFAKFPATYRAVILGAPTGEAKGELNLRSALTHIVADTYRSVAVIVAALVAQSTNVPASHADAVSAMIVSFPIIVMTLALVVNVARRVLGRALGRGGGGGPKAMEPAAEVQAPEFEASLSSAPPAADPLQRSAPKKGGGLLAGHANSSSEAPAGGLLAGHAISSSDVDTAAVGGMPEPETEQV